MNKLVLLLMLCATPLWADPISYQLSLTVEGGTQALCRETPYTTFGCQNSLGDIHIGSFNLDNGIVSDFLLQIGSVVWNQDAPSDFWGIHPFTLQGNQLTGGVYGSGDVPFVDFLGSRFSAIDPVQTLIWGGLEVHQVDEPSTLFLLGVGLGFLAFMARRWM